MCSPPGRIGAGAPCRQAACLATTPLPGFLGGAPPGRCEDALESAMSQISQRFGLTANPFDSTGSGIPDLRGLTNMNPRRSGIGVCTSRLDAPEQWSPQQLAHADASVQHLGHDLSTRAYSARRATNQACNKITRAYFGAPASPSNLLA